MSKFKNLFWGICFLWPVLSCTTMGGNSNKKEDKIDFTKYVLPLMGSDSEFALSNGNLYPCIARPWGMNHWTPQTAVNGERWQYTYDSKYICFNS